MFSGSYAPEDVTFLLKVIDMPATTLLEKERLIHSGARHYSDMIGIETPPGPEYMALFHAACARNNARFAGDLVQLARHLAAEMRGEIVLVSLARAGTPVGVLLRRILVQRLGREARHYSISIVRDRGIDAVALQHILCSADSNQVVFVDGWTGKGVIARELAASVQDFNRCQGTSLPTGLVAVADLCGHALAAATVEDYLVPSCLLNSVVSGLVSRSILNRDYVREDDFHGCLFYPQWRHLDLSRSFVDAVMAEVAALPECAWTGPLSMASAGARRQARRTSADAINGLMREFGIRSSNAVKPGIAESTRVLLRRAPRRLLLRSAAAPDVQHLLHLAAAKHVGWEERPALPFAAVALISESVS